MEDALNLWEVEYLSNHLLDLPQLLNLSQGTKPELKISVIKTTSDGKLPQVETKIENYMKSKTTLKHAWPSNRPPSKPAEFFGERVCGARKPVGTISAAAMCLQKT